MSAAIQVERLGRFGIAAHMHLGRWLIPAAVAIFFLLLSIPLTKTKPESWNDISRVAAIEALVEQGTWSIDHSPWVELTQDKVFINDKFYSGKMPLFSWLGAGVYAGLHDLGGLSLAPDCATPSRGCAYYWLTLILVGVPGAAMIGLMYDFARRLNLSVGVALLGLLSLALGTMVLPYSLVFNHDVPSAVSLFAGFYLLTTRAAQDSRWLLESGLLAAFAICCDPLSGVMATVLFVIALARFRQRAIYFVLGALPPFLMTMWLDLQITGTLLPPYLIPSAYDYAGAIPGRGFAGTGQPDDLAQYAFKMFLGAQGLFAYDSVLLFAIAGIVIVALTRGHRLRIEAIMVGVGFIALGLYLALRTGNLGGEAYGERWFVQSLPMIMAFIFFAPPLAQHWRLAASLGFGAALLLSMLSTYQGAIHPWRYTPPPFHLTRNAEDGSLGFKWEFYLSTRQN